MDQALERILAKSSAWAESAPPRDAGAQLMADLRPLGATVFNSRVYHRPRSGLDVQGLWRLNGFQEKLDPPGWAASPEHAFICLEHNPLIDAPRRWLRRFRFSDLAPKDSLHHGPYWEAWSRIGTTDGLGLLSYAPDGRTGSLAIGFERMEALSPAALDIVALAGRVVLTGLLDAGAGLPPQPTLTAREREVMALVARGLTDDAIAGVLSISATTARAHADSARRKLDAANRAEAAALFVRWGYERED